MNIWDNIEHLKHVIETSTNYSEVFTKLGLDPNQSPKKLIEFIKQHKLIMLPLKAL